MRHTVWLAMVAALTGCARTPPEVRLIHEAADAVGGRPAIESVKTIVLEGDGANFNLGQNRSPAADLPEFKVTGFRRAIDVAGGRWRQEQTRTPTFPAGNPAPQKQVAGLDGDVAFNVAADGTVTRASERIARDRRAELMHHPVGILRAAMAEGTRLGNLRQYGNHDVVDVTPAQGGTFTLSIDSATKLPARVVSMISNTNLGDVAMETEFGGYKDAGGGLKLPTELTTRLDKYTTAKLTLSASRVNGDTGDLSAPAAATSAPAASAPTVTVEALAAGVWLLAGQSHHSVVIEFSDHLTLIEAPQDDARTLAVIAKARELVPGKPLTKVVNTHHHFDHSGGVRAAVSEGLTLVTHEGNKTFYEDMMARAHTIEPDHLAKNPKPLRLQPVAGRLEMKDASMTVEIYPVTGSLHCDTMLMAYLPKQRLLVEVDLYAPPAPNAAVAPAFPFAPNLLQNIQDLKLKVDRVVPLHGRIAPFRDLVAAATGTAGR